MTRKIVNTNMTNKLFDYMAQSGGKPMTADRIAADAGVPRVSVLNSMSYLVNHKPELGVVRLKQAVYAYRPDQATAQAAPASPRTYEEIGFNKDGQVVIRRDDGKLYTLTEL